MGGIRAGTSTSVTGGVHVLHIVQSGDHGGVQRHVRDLALGLRDTTAGVAVGTTGWLTTALEREGVPIAVLPGLERGVRPDRVAVAAHALRHTRTALGATVLHAHGVLALATATRWRPSVPVVYTAHGMQWRDGAHGVVVRTASRALHRWVARRGAVAAVVAISSQEEADALAMGFPAEIVHRVPNGVAVEPDDALRAALEARRANVVGVATRLVPGKGVEEVVGAVAQLPDAQLVLAGDGLLVVPLQRAAARLGMSTRIQFLGWQEALEDFYATIAVYVSMSQKEGLPYAVLDAMARAVPAVASDIPGHRDLIVDGETGFLVNCSTQLVSRIKQLLNDPPLRERMGRAAALRVRAEFSIGNMLCRNRRVQNAAWQGLPA